MACATAALGAAGAAWMPTSGGCAMAGISAGAVLDKFLDKVK